MAGAARRTPDRAADRSSRQIPLQAVDLASPLKHRLVLLRHVALQPRQFLFEQCEPFVVPFAASSTGHPAFAKAASRHSTRVSRCNSARRSARKPGVTPPRAASGDVCMRRPFRQTNNNAAVSWSR